MTTYTEEDFKTAQFARHPNGWIAARFDNDLEPWCTDDDIWRTDARMARDGWVPVREAGESAKWAYEYNEGDVLVYRHPGSSAERVEVWRPEITGPTTTYTRILHRAPKPTRPEGAEALEALLDELDEWDDLTRGEEPALLADWLAERGVRVTEGEK